MDMKAKSRRFGHQIPRSHCDIHAIEWHERGHITGDGGERATQESLTFPLRGSLK